MIVYFTDTSLMKIWSILTKNAVNSGIAVFSWISSIVTLRLFSSGLKKTLSLLKIQKSKHVDEKYQDCVSNLQSYILNASNRTDFRVVKSSGIRIDDFPDQIVSPTATRSGAVTPTGHLTVVVVGSTSLEKRAKNK